MTATIQDRLIALAKGEVGYHEGRSNGHWNNQEKYANQVPALAWAQGQAWCDVFVAWLFTKVGGTDLIPISASTDASMAAWKKLGRWSEYPAIGAQVIFGTGNNADHTGFVIGYDAKTVTTVEGNTNSTGAVEGDGVYQKTHQRTDVHVLGYGLPKYPGGIQSADPKFAHESPAKVKSVPAKPKPAGPTRVQNFHTKYAKTGVIDLNILDRAAGRADVKKARAIIEAQLKVLGRVPNHGTGTRIGNLLRKYDSERLVDMNILRRAAAGRPKGGAVEKAYHRIVSAVRPLTK